MPHRPLHRALPLPLTFLLGATLACSDSTEDLADAGTIVDATTGPDLGVLDTGEEDAGEEPDAGAGDTGRADAGRIDPMAEPFRTIYPLNFPNPPPYRFDIVIVGDGYTVDELATTYARHVRHLSDRIFSRRPNGAAEPFYQFRNLFNVHRVHLASNESGIDDPEASQTRDTALDGTTRCTGLDTVCLVDTAKVRAAVDRALMGTRYTPDLIVVVLNTERPIENAVVNASGKFAIYGGGPTMAEDANTGERALRQIARAMAGLELTNTGMGAYTGMEPTAANLTLSATGEKWRPWLGFDAQNDGQMAVGAVAGGLGFATGIHRPTPTSKMAGNIPGPFDPVEREAIIQALFATVPLVVENTPNSGAVMNPPFLDAIPADNNLATVTWFVDDMDVGLTPPSSRFGFTAWAMANGVAAGPHTVEARVTARTRFLFPDCMGCRGSQQDFVRRPTEQMRASVRWNVVYRP